MHGGIIGARHVRLAAALAALLLVAACLFVPGKFEARMEVMRDGRFTYRYTGEVQFLSSISAMDAERGRIRQFDADSQVCYDPPPGSGRRGEGAGKGGAVNVTVAEPQPLPVPAPPAPPPSPPPPQPPGPRVQVTVSPPPPTIQVPVIRPHRKCTAEELAQRRRDWERSMTETRSRRDRERDQMKAMLGGIDPGDPATMSEFARRLQGQGGWKKVVHKGDGLFEVDYEISGRLDHDFVFPVFDRVEFIMPFVQATRLGSGKVRITAPAFVKPGAEWMGMSAAGAAAAMGRERNWPFREAEGTFTLVTDAAILTNNTREGPSSEGGSQILKWTVSPLDRGRPEALLQL